MKGPPVRRGGPEAAPSKNHQAATKLPDDKLSLIPLGNPLDEVAQHVDGAFVVVVRANGGKYRRRCFLSVAAAERAAHNALDAGYHVEVYLAQLKPLWRLAGGAVAS
jgi:hypothetical protein